MIKVFKSALNSAAFNTESLDLYPLPAGTADSLLSDEVPASKDPNDLFKYDHITDTRTRFAELVLLITQTCNLKCSYCFAEAYMDSNSDNRVMSPATARISIEKILKSVTDLRKILFFGGEPLIGFAAIRESVKASEEYCRAYQAQMPAFTISTNGTLINQKIIDFFQKHNFSVIISLDGPQAVNDKQRKFRSGKGTYDTVIKKIDLLRDAGIEISIEVVFTDNHKYYKETIESTYEFLTKLGGRDIILTPAIGGSPDESINESLLTDLEQNYTASTEKIMDSWLTDSPIRMPYWFDIMHTLLSRNSSARSCGAGFERITVDCSGKVFPCYMLISDSLFMGNVNDKDFPGKNFTRVTALMRRTSKDSFAKCVKCWAKNLCSPCYGDTFFANGNLSAPRESICVIIRAVAKAILMKVTEFVTDDARWKKFAENVNWAQAQFDIECKAKKQ